jgi:hypothetical protein
LNFFGTVKNLKFFHFDRPFFGPSQKNADHFKIRNPFLTIMIIPFLDQPKNMTPEMSHNFKTSHNFNIISTKHTAFSDSECNWDNVTRSQLVGSSLFLDSYKEMTIIFLIITFCVLCKFWKWSAFFCVCQKKGRSNNIKFLLACKWSL